MKPSRTFGKIVVALDAQGHADHALQAAVWLAERTQAELTISHAVGVASASWTYVEDARDAARDRGLVSQATRAIVRHATSLVGRSLPGGFLTVERVRVRAGRPSDVVVAEARERDADLVVVGHDARRLRTELGGTVRQIVAQAPKAVWLQKHALAPIRRLLVPIDLSPDSLRALEAASKLAKSLDASVTVLHAFSSPGFVVSAWPDYPEMGSMIAIDEVRDAERVGFERAIQGCNWFGVEHSAHFVEGDPATAILEHQHEADLIVLGTHGRSRLATAFMGSVAWRVLREARHPVLAVRHPEREFVHG